MSSDVMALFPGMAAGHPGMGSSLISEPVAREVFVEFSLASGVDVAALVCEATREELEQDRHWELATVACEMAAAKAYSARGGRYGSALGFSIGAYAALASAGVIGVAQIVAMIDIVLGASRALDGRFAMTAVLGLTPASVSAFTGPGEVEIAAVLSASHILVAGRESAVGELERKLAPRALRVTRLGVRWPLHTGVMQPVSDALRDSRRSLGTFEQPGHPIFSLHHGRAIGSADECWVLLTEHLCHPQRLDIAVAAARQAGVRQAIELGPGTTLSRAMRWLARDEISCGSFPARTAERTSASGRAC